MSAMPSEVTVETLDAFARAWNRHDGDAIMAFMTEESSTGDWSAELNLRQ